MKKLIVVTTKKTDNKKTFADFLQGKLVHIGEFSLKIDNVSDLALSGKSIDKSSIIYFRKIGDKNLSIVSLFANFLDKNGIEFIDKSLLSTGRWEDKLSNYYYLSQDNINIIPSIYSSNFEEVKNYLGTPFIAKEINTHRNKNIKVVRSKIEFEKIQENESEKYMFQKFMEIESEYRLLVLGDKVGTVLVKDKRIYDGQLVTTPEGIPEEYLDVDTIDTKLIEMAVKSAKILNIQVAGVDIMVEKNTGKIYIVEINRGPGITLDTNKSPELPELKKYIDNLIND